MASKTLEDLFHDQLQDAYSAEKQLTKALPKMAKAAKSADLRAGFEQHLKETQNQVQRLERVCEQVGCKTGSNTCEAMEGLIEEGDEIVGLGLEPDAQDAGLIAAAQKVEHYEIALYGTLCAFPSNSATRTRPSSSTRPWRKKNAPTRSSPNWPSSG